MENNKKSQEDLKRIEEVHQESSGSKLSAIAIALFNNDNPGKRMTQADKESYESEILGKVMGIAGEIKNMVPGLSLPPDLTSLILDHMLSSIEAGITDLSKLGNGEAFGKEIFEKKVLTKMDSNDVIDCIKKNQESGIYCEYTADRVHEICTKGSVEEQKENSLVFIEILEEMQDLEGITSFKIPEEGKTIVNEYGENVMAEIEYEDGSSIIVTQSDDPEQQISQELAIGIGKVQAKEQEIRNLIGACRDDNESIETVMNRYNNIISTDNGNYAALEIVYENMQSYGIDAVVSSQNTFVAQSFNILVDKMLDDRMSGKSQTEDSYTKGLKLGIISNIENSSILNPNDPVVQEIRRKLNEAEPELYALIERDPQVFKKMQTAAQDSYHEQATLAVTGNANGIPGNDFFEKVQEFLERNKDLEVDEQYTCKEVAQEIEESIAESKPPKKELSEEEIIEKKTKHLLDAAEKKGVGFAISTVLPGITGNKPNHAANIVSTILDPETRGQDGNLLDSIQTEDDLDGIKKAITSLISRYQSQGRDFSIERTIEILQNTLQEESERINAGKLLSPDTVDIEAVVRETTDEQGLIKGMTKESEQDDREI